MESNKIINTKAGISNYIWNYSELDILVEILINIKDKNSMRDFLTDLLNSREISDILRRIILSYAIHKGFTFRELIDKLGVNPNTISRLRKKIYFGKGKLKETLENISISKIDKELETILETREINYKSNQKEFKPVIYGHKFPKNKQ